MIVKSVNSPTLTSHVSGLFLHILYCASLHGNVLEATVPLSNTKTIFIGQNNVLLVQILHKNCTLGALLDLKENTCTKMHKILSVGGGVPFPKTGNLKKKDFKLMRCIDTQ